MSEQRKRRLEALIKSKVSLEIICERMGYKNSRGLRKAATQYEITLPCSIEEQLATFSRNSRYDSDLALGLPMMEIAQRQGCTRQNIYFYIQKTKQQEFYRAQRERVKQSVGNKGWSNGVKAPIFFQQFLIDVLHSFITVKCTEKGFAYEKAWHAYTTKNLSRNFSELLALFEGYEYALNKGVKLSLKEFGECLELPFPSLSRIFKREEIEPMYGTNPLPSRKISRYKKQRILACFDLPLSIEDLAYFSGIKPGSINSYFARPKTKRIKSWRDRRKWERHLTYRLASQIFEAKDASFSLDEMCEYAATKPNIVEFALEHRTEIEKPIITGLQRLYPQKDIKAPYLITYGVAKFL